MKSLQQKRWGFALTVAIAGLSGTSVGALPAETNATAEPSTRKLRHEFREAVKSDNYSVNILCQAKLVGDDVAGYAQQVKRFEDLLGKIRQSELAFDLELAVDDMDWANRNALEKCTDAPEEDASLVSIYSLMRVDDRAKSIDKIENAFEAITGYVSPRINPTLSKLRERRAILRSDLTTYLRSSFDKCPLARSSDVQAAVDQRNAAYSKLEKTLQASSLRLDYQSAYDVADEDNQLYRDYADCDEPVEAPTLEQVKKENDRIVGTSEILAKANDSALSMLPLLRGK
jgi:hypothetical protein